VKAFLMHCGEKRMSDYGSILIGVDVGILIVVDVIINVINSA